jgi:hypothetical protein
MNVLIHQKNSKKKKSNIENIYLIKDSLFVTLSSIIIIIIINIGVRVSFACTSTNLTDPETNDHVSL